MATGVAGYAIFRTGIVPADDQLDEKIEDYETLRADVVLMLTENKKEEVFTEHVMQLNEKAEIEDFVSVDEPEDEEA